jgi:putative oxidoreductase
MDLKHAILGNSRHVDAALLLVRLGIGLSMLVFHGWGKITGGPEAWERLGGSMENLGITFAPVVWGFLAAFAEAVGSVLLVLGILFRPATFLLAGTMVVAAINHISRPEGTPGAGWGAASHALELLVIYVALFLAGPGKYRLPLGPRS